MLNRFKQDIRVATHAAVLLLISACAATHTTVLQELDEQTGVTVSYSQTPLTMVRDTPRYGAYARSFVQLGAIEINRTGTRQYFLWLGTWNTEHVASIAEHRDGFDSVVLFVDGEPLLLDVFGWTPDAIGTSGPVYTRPFASSVDSYYRVTTNQISMIANAQDIRLRTSSAAPRDFEPWDEQHKARESLRIFLGTVSP